MLVLTTDIASYENHSSPGFIPESLEFPHHRVGLENSLLVPNRALTLELVHILIYPLCITCNTGENYGHVDP